MTTNNETAPKGSLSDEFKEIREKQYAFILQAAMQERNTILADMQAKGNTKAYDVTYFQSVQSDELDTLSRDHFARLITELDIGLPDGYSMMTWCGSLGLEYKPKPIPAEELLIYAEEELKQVLKQLEREGRAVLNKSDPTFFVRTSENFYNHLIAKHRLWGIFPRPNPFYERLMAEAAALGVTVEEILLRSESAGYGPVCRIYLRINA